MAGIELRGVWKRYPGGVEAAAGVDLDVEAGSLFAVVGPSGSGKSTLLRLIAGLEWPDAGTIAIGGRRVDGLPPRDRDVAMVFQNPALYPHLDVAGNLAFGPRARGLPRDEVAARVAEAAAMLGIAGLLRRRPSELSGGQRQRVALGRAVARRPAVFLLDEPMSALDPPLRAAIRAELVELHRRLGATTVVVTHDQAEAMALGDRLAVVDRGRVLQVGPPREVYDRPADRVVAGFIGSPPMNVLPCLAVVEGWRARVAVEGLDPSRSATFPAPGALIARGGGAVDLGLRAEHLAVGAADAVEPGRLSLEGVVRRVEPLGHETIAVVAVGPHELAARLPGAARLGVGQALPVNLDLARAVWFERGTGRRLDPPASTP